VSSFFDAAVARAADKTIGDISSAFVSSSCNLANGRFAGIVMAPAGAGKSYLGASVVADAIESSNGQPCTIAVATPTNDQAFSFADTLTSRFSDLDVAYVHATNRRLPEDLAARANLHDIEAAEARAHPVIVGTLDKLGDAFARGTLPEFGYLLIDEAFQADGSKYFKVGGLADRHMLIGDYGQLEPFTTMQDPGRWRGLPEDPTQTAVSVLERNHPGVTRYKLPITRRLPPSALPVVRSFYPNHDFSAWTKPDARGARLQPSRRRNRGAAIDAALDRMASRGWSWVRLPDTPVVTADPLTIGVITDLVRQGLARGLELRDEKTRGRWRTANEDDIAVVVSHNDQKDYLRVALRAAGLEGVRVDTANKLQGLQFEFVVAWHPLAGLPEGDAFHLEPGRLCVMLTRHRHGCVVVGRGADPDLVDELPRAGETWIGHDADPVLDGWMAHRLVFEALDPFAVDVLK
jgi:hypothetical protein